MVALVAAEAMVPMVVGIALTAEAVALAAEAVALPAEAVALAVEVGARAVPPLVPMVWGSLPAGDGQPPTSNAYEVDVVGLVAHPHQNLVVNSLLFVLECKIQN